MTSSKHLPFVHGSILVPFYYDKRVLHRLGDDPVRYRYIGRLEEAIMIFPGLRDAHESEYLLVGHSRLDRMLRDGMQLTVIPYEDLKHAYVLGEKRVIN